MHILILMLIGDVRPASVIGRGTACQEQTGPDTADTERQARQERCKF